MNLNFSNYDTHPFLKTFEEVDAWLQKMGVLSYHINEDLSVWTTMPVSLNYQMDYIPVQFSKTQDFDCRGIGLKSLIGSPRIVEGKFMCDKNLLVDLIGAPVEVSRHFTATNNRLLTLQGAPKKVGSGFSCSHNFLTNLDNGPLEVSADYMAHNNPLQQITNFSTKMRNPCILWFPKNTDIQLHLSTKQLKQTTEEGSQYLYFEEFNELLKTFKEKKMLENTIGDTRDINGLTKNRAALKI